jgi:phosphohistidine phosphatase SixA
MGKTIIVMRHAEYDEDTGLVTENGKEDARDVAGQLITDNHVPNVIVHSESPRAKETAEVMAGTFRKARYEVTVKESRFLNDENKSHIFQSLRGLPETSETTLLITHNLALDAALTCMDYGTGKETDWKVTPSYPACAYLYQGRENLSVSWQDIRQNHGMHLMAFGKYYKPSRLEL